MNFNSATKILNQLVALYIYKGVLEDKERNQWIRYLKQKDFVIADKALERILTEIEPGSTYDRMPSFSRFKAIYLELAPSRGSWCPCCDGCGFILFEIAGGKTEATPCHCRTGGLKNDDVCQNLHCQNPTRVTKKTFLAGYSVDFPWKVAGWKQCNYHPIITEVKHLHIPIVSKNDVRVLGILLRAQCQTKNLFDLPHGANAPVEPDYKQRSAHDVED